MHAAAAPADLIFRALADPTRREILDAIGEGEVAATDLVRLFDMSQPAVSQHLKVLREAGLVEARKAGRQRMYRLVPGPLRTAFAWFARYERFWNAKLDGLGRFLDEMPDDTTAPDSPPRAPGAPAHPGEEP